MQFNFGSFCLKPDGTLLHDSVPVPLPPKELAILRILLCSAGQIVPLPQLQRAAWSNVHVSSESLPRCVSSLRARLNSPDSIQALYRRGYRFNLTVEKIRTEPNSAANFGQDQWVERRVLRSSSLLRIAFLPLTCGQGVPESFGPGIAEEAMLRLSHALTPAVEILARDSVFALASRNLTAQEIGKTLQADLAVTGTITALPLHFRLRAELLRVQDNTQLWIEDFLLPRHLLAGADAFIAQRITARILDSFAAPISPSKTDASPQTGKRFFLQGTAHTDRRAEAYSLYLDARHNWATLERHQMQDALLGFQQVTELDTTILSAQIHLVHAHLLHSSFGYVRPDIAAEAARKQAEIILTLPHQPQSIHPALGWIYFHCDRNLAAANAAFARIEAPTYNPWSVHYRVKFALSLSRFAEAIEILRTALRFDSHSPWMLSSLAWALHLAGDPAASLKQADAVLALFPEHPVVLLFCANILAASGTAKSKPGIRAIEIARRLVQLAPSLDASHATLAYACARNGLVAEARSILERQMWLGTERFVMRSFHAPALVELGDLDLAIQELAVAEQQHCPWFFQLLADPRLQPLHEKREFQKLTDIPRNLESASIPVA